MRLSLPRGKDCTERNKDASCISWRKTEKSRENTMSWKSIRITAAVQTHMKNLRKNKNPTMAKLMDASKKPVVTIMPIVGDPGLKLGEPKFAIVAVVPAKDLNGLESAIAPALNEVHTKEPGTLMYCLGRDEKRNAMVFLELYTDMAAIGTHGKTAYFKAMGSDKPNLLGEPIISLANMGMVASNLLKNCNIYS